MKRLLCSLAVMSALVVVGCDVNKKLNQANAEKGIKDAIPQHVVNQQFGMWERELCFNVPSIASIEPVRQFSETEAKCVVKFKCTQPFALDFVFQKNIDKQWFLTGFERGMDYGTTGGQITAMINANKNLKVLAQ